MSGKLLWTGLTCISAAIILPIPAIQIVGAVLMVLGTILMWLDK